MTPFERQLRELREFDARGAGVLSLYLCTDPHQLDLHAVADELERLTGALKSGLEPAQRQELDEEVSAVRDYLGSMLAPPTGLAVFSCTPRRFFRIVRLPVAVMPAAYWAQWAHVNALVGAARQAAVRAHDFAAV